MEIRLDVGDYSRCGQLTEQLHENNSHTDEIKLRIVKVNRAWFQTKT